MNIQEPATTKLRDRGRIHKRGATIVEFAIIAPLLFLLLFSIFELGVLFWVNLTMQHAVREGARYAITGRVDLDPNPVEEERIRSLAIEERIRRSSLGLYDSVSTSPIVVTDPDGNVVGSFGGPGETVVIRLNCAWRLMTPLFRAYFSGGTFHFTVSATMRNEAF